MTEKLELHEDKSSEGCAVIRVLTETDRRPLLEAVRLQEEASERKIIEFEFFFPRETAIKAEIS